VLLYMTLHLKVDPASASLLAALALALGAPLFVGFGALSDRIGRKRLILGGCLLAALGTFPLFDALTRAANPALADAQRTVPVALNAPAHECSWQFNPLADAAGRSPCDAARQWLAARAVRYHNVADGGPTFVTIAGRVLTIATDLASQQALNDALDAAGYPQGADPARINRPLVVAIVFVLVVFAAMVYGPIAALLVELFATRVRCSSVSLPYHIGNGWFGGLLPAITFAIGAQTGDLLAGLWYTVGVALLTVVIGLLWVPETKDRQLDTIA
jgi:MFS family permease